MFQWPFSGWTWIIWSPPCSFFIHVLQRRIFGDNCWVLSLARCHSRLRTKNCSTPERYSACKRASHGAYANYFHFHMCDIWSHQHVTQCDWPKQPRPSLCTAVVRDRRRPNLYCRALWLDWIKGILLLLLKYYGNDAASFCWFLWHFATLLFHFGIYFILYWMCGQLTSAAAGVWHHLVVCCACAWGLWARRVDRRRQWSVGEPVKRARLRAEVRRVSHGEGCPQTPRGDVSSLSFYKLFTVEKL